MWNVCVFLLVFPVLCIFCGTGGAEVPSAVWQDNSRAYRDIPATAPRQNVGKPQVNLGIPLDRNADSIRASSVRNSLATDAGMQPVQPQPGTEQGEWRLRVQPAAVVQEEHVHFGEIARPLGNIPSGLWEKLAATELWKSPPEPGKPLQINKSRLAQALRKSLGPDIAQHCILPSSLVLQRGGAVFTEEELRSYVVKSLTPLLNAMPGKADLTDFRLPEYIFLTHPSQQVQLEPGKLLPGRVPLRFAVQELDGRVLRRVAGTVNLDLRVEVPSAARPINRGEVLQPQDITFIQVNTARLRESPWDGRGGPWQAARAIATGEPVLQSDLIPQTTIQRGEIVTLRFERGAVAIETRVEALKNGSPGETVPVRNLQTKKQIYATVRDGTTVIIE